MRRFFYLILILLFVPVGLAFTVLNSQNVPLDVYFARREAPLAVIVIASVFAGALLGIFANYLTRIRYRSEIRGLRKQLTRAEQTADKTGASNGGEAAAAEN